MKNQKDNVMNIPNILSIFRILLIPLFIYLYFLQSREAAAIVLVISASSDILDGIIARKFDMITHLGKFLDPCADKLTQAAVCCCLAIKHNELIILFVIYFLKELLMLIGGIIILKSGKKIAPSKWFGKLSTCIIFVIIFMFIIMDEANTAVTTVLVGIAITTIVATLVMYIFEYVKIKGEVNDL